MKTLQRIGFVILFLSLFSIFQICFADPPLPTPIGRVVWVKGLLKAVMTNNEQRTLQKMSVIYLHDTLVTDDKSEGEIAFTDESLVTFYPNSRFVVDQYVYKQKDKSGSASKYIVNLIEGGFRTITGLIAKNAPTNYQINTPVATIGVRGTDFAIYYKDHKLYAARYKGKPCVTGKDSKQTALCLDDTVRYTMVNENQAPVPLSEMPAVFSEQLTITPFTISPFGVQGGGGQGGVVSSFCITQ